MEKDVKKYYLEREKKSVKSEIKASLKKLEDMVQTKQLTKSLSPFEKETLERAKVFIQVYNKKYGEGLYRLEDLDVERNIDELECLKKSIKCKIKELEQCSPRSVESYFSKRKMDFNKRLRGYPNTVSRLSATNNPTANTAVIHNGYEIELTLEEAKAKIEEQEERKEQGKTEDKDEER